MIGTFVLSEVWIFAILDVPVASRHGAGWTDNHVVAREKLPHMLEERRGCCDVTVPQEVSERLLVQCPGDRTIDKEGFDLRRKADTGTIVVQIQRFDADTIASEKQLPP